MFLQIGCDTQAAKRYQRRVSIAATLYVVTLLACRWVANPHVDPDWLVYTLAVLPAIPILAVLVALGRYLQEESDEYQRMLKVRSLLVAAGALLSTIVINDFLRAMAGGAAIPPFICFVIFFVTFGVAQGVQQLVARGE